MTDRNKLLIAPPPPSGGAEVQQRVRMKKTLLEQVKNTPGAAPCEGRRFTTELWVVDAALQVLGCRERLEPASNTRRWPCKDPLS